MRIIVALDDVIRDVESAWFQYAQETKTRPFEAVIAATSEEWLDYKSLIPPRKLAEDTINAWYDANCEVYILTHKDKYNIKWLKDHFIPYDAIIEFPNMDRIDYCISANLQDCLDISCREEMKKIFHFKTHQKTNKIDYTIPSSANPSKITTIMNWSDIAIKENKWQLESHFAVRQAAEKQQLLNHSHLN